MNRADDLLHFLRTAAGQPPEAVTDDQLLARFVERRDAGAFHAIVGRHGPMVWGVCLRLLRDRSDAEDAFQATFLVLVRKADAVSPRGAVGNWLYGVACRAALKARTDRAARREKERRAAAMRPQESPESDSDEFRQLLDTELSRLPDKYRAPVVLCDLEGKTRAEAAHELGWPEGTVA
ncbi:MAG TPA: sigma-70 family RNA polymerase sigma factor, partial [Gemmataceae bacterium]